LIGFFFHVIDALYYSVINVLPAKPDLSWLEASAVLAQLPGREVQSPELLSPKVECGE